MSVRRGHGWGYVIFIALLILAICVIAYATSSPSEAESVHPGAPLDAVSYEPPKWMPDCHECRRVTDRMTGRSWWVLTLNGNEHLVLPIETGTM